MTAAAGEDGTSITRPPIPPTHMNTSPKTTWWMWWPPGVTFPGHQRTWRRIMRTLNRMNRKVTMNAARKQNMRSRPVSTISRANQSLMTTPFPPRYTE